MPPSAARRSAATCEGIAGPGSTTHEDDDIRIRPIQRQRRRVRRAHADDCPQGAGTRVLPEYSRPSWARIRLRGTLPGVGERSPWRWPPWRWSSSSTSRSTPTRCSFSSSSSGRSIAATGATARQTLIVVGGRRRGLGADRRGDARGRLPQRPAPRGHRGARHRRRDGRAHRPPARSSRSATPRASPRSTAWRARSPRRKQLRRGRAGAARGDRPAARTPGRALLVDRRRRPAQVRRPVARGGRARRRRSSARLASSSWSAARACPVRRGRPAGRAGSATRSTRAPSSVPKEADGRGAPRRHGVPRDRRPRSASGVIEVFSREVRERDPGVYALTEALGLQVGDFIEALRLQDERTQAREQLEAILSGVADAVTAQAPDGRLLFANEAAARSHRLRVAEELMDAPITTIMDRYEIIDERGEPFPLEALPGRRALGGEENAETVVRFRVRDTGEERWSAVKATPIRDHDGNVDDGDQRHRGHHHPQARGAGTALPGTERRRARLLARPRPAARGDRQPRGARAGGLVLRRGADRRRPARAQGARAREPGRAASAPSTSPAATRRTPTRPRASTRSCGPASPSSTRTSRTR